MLEAIMAAIPDVEVFLSLEPEELAAKLLFVFRQFGDSGTVHLGNLQNRVGEGKLYASSAGVRDRREDISLALTEAWAWLEAQGLLVPAAGHNGQNGFRVLSRRARRFVNEAEFANYASARMLRRELLHSRIATPVWSAFMRGEYDAAVFQAMKAVEVAVREASGLGDGVIGVRLMREAFKDNGPLADMTTEGGERQARSDLFAGAIGSYKNPHSHRDVNLNDPKEAFEIILLANHLLRIVDARRPVRAGSGL